MNPGRVPCAGLSFGQLGESASLDVADSLGAMWLPGAKRQGTQEGPLPFGTRGGDRTHTSLTGHGILSPARLPVPPLWRRST